MQVVEVPPAGEFFGAVAEHVFHDGGDEHVAPLRIDLPDEGAALPGGLGEARFAFPQRPFDPRAGRDVARDAMQFEAAGLAAAHEVADGLGRHRRAVLARLVELDGDVGFFRDPAGEEIGDVALQQMEQPFAFLRRPGFLERLGADFVGGVAAQVFHGGADVGETPGLDVENPDDVLHAFGQQAVFLFAFPQRGFGPLAGGDVAREENEPAGGRARIALDGDGRLEPALAIRKREGIEDALAPGRYRGGFQRAANEAGGRFGQDVRDIASQETIRGQIQLVVAAAVVVADAPVAVDHEEQIGHGPEKRFQAEARIRRRGRCPLAVLCACGVRVHDAGSVRLSGADSTAARPGASIGPWAHLRGRHGRVRSRST